MLNNYINNCLKFPKKKRYFNFNKKPKILITHLIKKLLRNLKLASITLNAFIFIQNVIQNYFSYLKKKRKQKVKYA